MKQEVGVLGRNQEITQKYAIEVRNRFDALDFDANNDNPEDMWKYTSDILTDSAVKGFTKNNNQKK